MAPTELTLRPAEESDADVVARIHLASRRAAPMPAPVHTDDEVRSWMRDRVREDEVWLAVDGGEAVGYARFTPTWLDDLYVTPEASGHGVGSALLDLVKAQRPDGFCLWVFESNSPARTFYARRGFVELEATDGSGNEEHAPDLRMAWPGEDPLAFFRRLIDEVDEDLGDLLARRAALTRAVQPHKSGPGRDPARERDVVRRLAARAPALGEERLARIAQVVITESLEASRQDG